jgi:hypothetical protein
MGTRCDLVFNYDPLIGAVGWHVSRTFPSDRTETQKWTLMVLAEGQRTRRGVA